MSDLLNGWRDDHGPTNVGAMVKTTSTTTLTIVAKENLFPLFLPSVSNGEGIFKQEQKKKFLNKINENALLQCEERKFSFT